MLYQVKDPRSKKIKIGDVGLVRPTHHNSPGWTTIWTTPHINDTKGDRIMKDSLVLIVGIDSFYVHVISDVGQGWIDVDEIDVFT